ncbi:MAG TPA: response regulator transcription factor [Candidatus Onthovicinus excrementipullorum]|nr:response regulator transcription factor [Candidatus Onthovicinus excrementipullorum]
MKIAIVEDDARIAQELSLFLERNGYDTLIVQDFVYAADEILGRSSDLALLDLYLPGSDGCKICRELRRRSDLPIIMVTSSDSEADELSAMNVGADDYVTKPYNVQILLMRIKNALRRAYHTDPGNELTFGGVILHVACARVTGPTGECGLSRNETMILEMLMHAGENIVTREQLMNAIWQTDEFVDENTLTVNVNRLRRKLRSVGAEDLVKTHKGQGYSL